MAKRLPLCAPASQPETTRQNTFSKHGRPPSKTEKANAVIAGVSLFLLDYGRRIAGFVIDYLEK
jgi:hypothetical protein